MCFFLSVRMFPEIEAWKIGQTYMVPTSNKSVPELAIIYQWLTIINHHEPLSTTINHY